VFEFITRGSFERHLGELRTALKARRDTMLAAIERHMPGSRYSRPEGGYFVWLELPGQNGESSTNDTSANDTKEGE